MPPEDKTGLLNKLLAGSDYITRGAQAVLMVMGAVGSIWNTRANNPAVFWLSISLVATGVLWLALGAHLRKTRPKPPILAPEARSSSSYLRGLLPFEKGDSLLGRDQEVARLLAVLRSLDFRVAFLSGEAGAGKTSLLRARIA